MVDDGVGFLTEAARAAQYLTLNPVDGAFEVQVADLALAGTVFIRRLRLAFQPGTGQAPSVARVMDLEAFVTDLGASRLVRDRQAGVQDAGRAMEILDVRFLTSGMEVAAVYRGAKVPVNIRAATSVGRDRWSNLLVRLPRQPGVLGLVSLPLARVAAQELRSRRASSRVIAVRQTDGETISVAPRLDGRVIFLLNLTQVEHRAGELRLVCHDPAGEPAEPQTLVPAEEAAEPVASGARCLCPSCLALEFPAPEPARQAGWLSSLVDRVVGSGPSSPPRCSLTLDDLALQGRHEDLLARVDAALAADGGQLGPWLRKAEALLARGDRSASLAACDAAAASHPRTPELLRCRARILTTLGRSDEAVERLERAADEAAAAAPALLREAALLALEAAPLGPRASGLLARMQALAPAAPATEHVRGELARARGAATEAMEAFEAGLAALPFDPGLLRSQAKVLIAERRPAEARFAWEALRLARPWDVEAARYLEERPGQPGRRAAPAGKLGPDDVARVLLWPDRTQPEQAARLNAARAVLEALVPHVAWLADDGAAGRDLPPLGDERATRALLEARQRVEGAPEARLVAGPPAGMCGPSSGAGWIALPPDLPTRVEQAGLVALLARELVRTTAPWPRLRPRPDAASLVTTVARRVALEGQQPPPAEEGFVAELLSSRMGHEATPTADDRDLDPWFAPERRATLRPLCQRFVDLQCTPADVAAAQRAYEWALDRVALGAVPSLDSVARAVAAVCLTPQDLSEALRYGLPRWLSGRATAGELAARLAHLARFARSPLAAELVGLP